MSASNSSVLLRLQSIERALDSVRAELKKESTPGLKREEKQLLNMLRYWEEKLE